MQDYKLTHYSSITDLPLQHQKFIETNDQGSIFLTIPWFKNLEETVFSPNTINIYALEDENGYPQLIFPCLKSADFIFGVKGTSSKGLNNYYSSHFSPIYDQSTNEETQLKSFNALIRNIKSLNQYDMLDYSQLDNEDISFSQVAHALKSSKFTTEPYFCFGNWYLKLNNRSFEEYYNSLSSKLRNTIKRKTNKLSKEQTYRIETIENETELHKYIDDYNKIYHKSWKNKEPYPDFIPGLVTTAAREGWLRMGILYVNDIPAASQLWLIYKGTANIYKLAYDEDFSKYSVGSILSKYLFEIAIDKDKVHTIDYLTGDDSYKRDWMSHRRERWGIRAYNKSLFGILNIFKLTLKKLTKKRDKKTS